MIVLDGIPAEQLGMHVLKDYVDPSITATRDSGVVIPGRHGEIDFGAYLERKEFNFPIVLIPQSSYQEALDKTDELKNILLDNYGRPRTFELLINDRPDRYYNVRYSGSLPINDLLKNRFFTLPLVAHEPFPFSVLKSDENLTWGSKIPFATRIAFGHKPSTFTVTGSQNLQVNNIGSLVVRPIVEISGTATALTLTINGESFSFGNLNNETLFIDAATYTVMKNGINHLFNTVGNLEKLELFPGKNTARIGGTNLNINVNFKFQGKYR
ncbi:phage tail family protein [Bacillus cereus group sp. BY142LC]|uniref:phage tail domain-containing protein n=1 Tax=Bacillus cereus group sp. BY142LC TaxID=3018083 RepID=UPI0022E2EE34|nr:phage tail domain-containing protein [Bacillus cereus group sp. BY142LC]MDA1834789.1 phage tail family protein [Bacillus cereus group sp. BY142LC]